jgi:hypothetical protein
MLPFRKSVLVGAALAAFVCEYPVVSAAAQQQPGVPDFSSNQAGWVSGEGRGPNFGAVPGHLPPVGQDPAHPYVPNGPGRQPTFRLPDLNNANLKPWVKAQMQKRKDEVLAGGIAITARSSCRPGGVPGFMAYGGTNEPIFFLQTPKEVWMIYQGNQEVRRIYLDVAHSAGLKPSWYGESVGHYEDDALVIDTVGMNDRTMIDSFGTPHTEKLHVMERWKLTEQGKMLEAIFTVEDPDSFYQPWAGMRRYRRVQQEMIEEPCAQNVEISGFDLHVPVAEKPDF